VRFARTRIELSALHEGKVVTLRVEDDGPGASAENYPMMLKRGVSVGDAGSGLGLAISGDIAEAYGGRLSLSRSELGGLEVALSLPASGNLVSAA
jgi:signal transduction histidine kinase